MMARIGIEELVEAGADGGDLMGYYCRGHVDRHLFAQHANWYSGAAQGYDVRWVDGAKASHQWWRTVPVAGEEGHVRYMEAVPGSHGAFPVTVCASVADATSKRIQRELRDQDRSLANGRAAGVNWAVTTLEAAGLKEAASVLLSKWRGPSNDA